MFDFVIQEWVENSSPIFIAHELVVLDQKETHIFVTDCMIESSAKDEHILEGFLKMRNCKAKPKRLFATFPDQHPTLVPLERKNEGDAGYDPVAEPRFVF